MAAAGFGSCAAAPPAPPPPLAPAPVGTVAKRRDPEWKLEASARALFSSNPFHYSDADLDTFDSKQGDGERFDGIESEWDVITRLEFGGTYEIPVAKHRKLELGLEGEHNVFLQNSLADYSVLGGKAAYDFTRHDQASLKLGYTPSRFKKNYKLESGEYDAAEYEQAEVILGYDRDIDKDWSAGVDLEYHQRDYNSTLDSRDREGTGLFAHAEYELSKHTSVGLAVGFEDVETETEQRAGLLIDRSFEQWSLSPTLKTRLGAWDVRVSLDFKRREYTTTESADDGRFDRVDNRRGVRVEGTKELELDGLEFSFLVGWRENVADLSDPTVPADETGYDELMAGLGLRLSF